MRRLRDALVTLASSLTAHPAAHGFVRGRSVETALQPHVGCQRLLHLDIANAFPSTTRRHVRLGLIRLGADPCVIPNLLHLCFEDESLPVGAPTSPFLFNVAMVGIDDELFDFGTYTRYADNILLSSSSFIINEGEVRQVIKERGYRLNESKCWHRIRGRHAMEVFGWTIGENGLRRPRHWRREERARLHSINGEF